MSEHGATTRLSIHVANASSLTPGEVYQIGNESVRVVSIVSAHEVTVEEVHIVALPVPWWLHVRLWLLALPTALADALYWRPLYILGSTRRRLVRKVSRLVQDIQWAWQTGGMSEQQRTAYMLQRFSEQYRRIFSRNED